MKANDFIEALERFFLDLIGTILPGISLLIGCCYVTKSSLVDFSHILFHHSTTYEWVFLLGFAYILGHAITSLGFKLTKKLEQAYESEEVREAFIGTPAKESKKSQDWILSFVSPEKEIEKKLSEDPVYKAF